MASSSGIRPLKLGSLRLREILQGIDVQSYDFHKVLHAFIKADLDLVKKLAPLKPINRLIATGSMISEIIQYSGAEKNAGKNH